MENLLNVGASAAQATIDAEWIVHQHQQQQEVNASILSALEDIQQRMNQSTQQRPLEGTPVENEPNPTREGSDTGGITTKRTKHSLTHPDKYDGENKAGYPAFKGHLRAKLRIDQTAIGGEPEQVWYSFGRLSGEAAARLFPWIEAIESQGKQLRVADFFDQLDAAFRDPQSTQRALEWINTRRQGKTPFREFLQQFEQKLLEAGGWEFSDSIRKGYLRAALNLEIRTQLVGRDEPYSYEQYVNLIRKVSDDLEQIKRMAQGRKQWEAAAKAKEDGEAMDWEPTPRTAAGTVPKKGRAKWVSQDTLDQRKKDRCCLRCGKDTHFIKSCPYEPARRPESPTRNGPPKTSSAVTKKEKMKPQPQEAREGYETDLEYESASDSGKE